MKIFLIDDDGYVSNHYRQALRRKGCYVELVSSVEQALLIAREGPDNFDVIVLDVMLPWAPYSESETAGGLHTGALLYRDLSKRFRDSIFVVLTNYDQSQVPPELKDPCVAVCNKAHYPPREFARFVLDLATRQ